MTLALWVAEGATSCTRVNAHGSHGGTRPDPGVVLSSLVPSIHRIHHQVPAQSSAGTSLYV